MYKVFVETSALVVCVLTQLYGRCVYAVFGVVGVIL